MANEKPWAMIINRDSMSPIAGGRAVLAYQGFDLNMWGQNEPELIKPVLGEHVKAVLLYYDTKDGDSDECLKLIQENCTAAKILVLGCPEQAQVAPNEQALEGQETMFVNGNEDAFDVYWKGFTSLGIIDDQETDQETFRLKLVAHEKTNGLIF